MGISFKKHAGLITMWCGSVTLHFFPLDQEDRTWSYRKSNYDGIQLHDLCFGPLLMVCWYD